MNNELARNKEQQKIVKELGTKIKNLGHGFRAKGHIIRKMNEIGTLVTS